MLHKTLLLFTTLLLSGCAERGFELIVNQTNHTVTAIKTVDTRDKKNNRTETDIKKMNTAVEKEQKKIKNPTDKIPTDTKKPVSQKKQNINRVEEVLKKEKQLTKAEAERLKHKNKIKAQKTAQNERDTLLKKQSLEKEKQLAVAKEEKLELENKIKAEILAQEEKITQLLKGKEAKLALKHKILEEQKRQEKEEKEVLKKRLTDQKIAKEEKLALALKTKKDTARKIRQDKVRKEKDTQARKMTEEKKRYLSLTEPLIFKQSRQTYQKFGTSEIHGHVVYMSPTGQEITPTHTKIYLVPKNTKIDYWYENYYLKNKEASISMNMTAEYINATYLNIEKNFAFYGLATGIYYVIIESSYPSSIAKNKKVYIAKKINVEKYKKIMTVFSKKL